MCEWFYSSLKRLSKSLGDSFEKRVLETRKKLSAYADQVRNEEERKNSVFVTRMLWYLGEKVNEGLQSTAIIKAQNTAIKMENAAIRAQMSKLSGTSTLAPGRDIVSTISEQAKPNTDADRLIAQSRPGLAEVVRASERYLQDPDTIHRLIEKSRSLFVSTEVFSRTRQWVNELCSGTLWIEGPPGISKPSQNTKTSAFMLKNLRDLGVPTMVYFCEYDAKQWRNYDREKEVIRLINALVVQAAQNLLESKVAPEARLDSLAARMNKLDGSIETIPRTIELLTDLMIEGSPLQFCVVDGLQILDHERLALPVRNGLKEVVEVMCKTASDRSSASKVFKILFTTDGLSKELVHASRSRTLIRVTYEDEEEDEPLHLSAADFP